MIHFYMTEAREIRATRDDGLPGVLLGRFLPGLSYQVTDGNKAKVEGWIGEGVAHIGILPGSAASLKLSGAVLTKQD